MAKAETWEKARYFRPDHTTDKWGDADEICDDLILRLDDFREFVGCKVFVTAGVKQAGHKKASYHYKENGACAVDIMLPDFKGTGLDLLLAAERFGFTGIGYYPDWRWLGKKIGGLHLDMRMEGMDENGTIDYRQSRWMGVEIAGRQVYLALNCENIKKYGGL